MRKINYNGALESVVNNKLLAKNGGEEKPLTMKYELYFYEKGSGWKYNWVSSGMIFDDTRSGFDYAKANCGLKDYKLVPIMREVKEDGKDL